MTGVQTCALPISSGVAEVVVGVTKWMACVRHVDHLGGNPEDRWLVLLGEPVRRRDLPVAGRRFEVGHSAFPFVRAGDRPASSGEALSASESTDLRR